MADPLTRLIAAPRKDRRGPLPVIVVSGFLGSGKTEVVARLVRDGAPRRLAWLVQSLSGRRDGHAGVVDAAWWRISERLAGAAGCVCCALRRDLLAGVKAAAADPAVDVLVVESAGTVMPGLSTEAVCALDEVSGLAGCTPRSPSSTPRTPWRGSAGRRRSTAARRRSAPRIRRGRRHVKAV